jgi:hypothetical protein
MAEFVAALTKFFTIVLSSAGVSAAAAAVAANVLSTFVVSTIIGTAMRALSGRRPGEEPTPWLEN